MDYACEIRALHSELLLVLQHCHNEGRVTEADIEEFQRLYDKLVDEGDWGWTEWWTNEFEDFAGKKVIKRKDVKGQVCGYDMR